MSTEQEVIDELNRTVSKLLRDQVGDLVDADGVNQEEAEYVVAAAAN